MSAARDTRPELTLDEALYQPLSGPEPMGPPPEDWEVSLLEMEFPSDASRLDANDPTPRNFHDRHERALELLEKTRDLRVYVRLCEALGPLEGAKGLHAGLHLVDAVTRNFWDTIHPGPPDEPRARNGRLRAFGPLRERKFATALDPHPVFNAGGFEGEITLRHFYLATERHTANKGRRGPQEGDETYTVDSLQKMVAKAEATEAVEATLTALRGAADLLRGLQAFLTEMPDYQRLNFGGAVEELTHYVAALEPFAGAPAAEPSAAQEGAEAAAPAAEPAAQPQAAIATVKSREEARALLDGVLGYYAVEARSSPVPLVLLKIRDMSGATFNDWLAAVASQGFENAALVIDGVDSSRLDEFMPTDGEGEAQAGTPAGTPPALDALDEALAALSANEAAAEAAPEEIERLSAAVAEARGALAEAAAAGAAAGARPNQSAPPIRDRVAVREALQKLALYYRAAEPSSPVSLCFERLIPLVDRPFMDIVREIAPGGNQAALRLAPGERGDRSG